MALFNCVTFNKNEASKRSYANYWDLIALILVSSVIAALGWGATHMSVPYHLGESIPVDLDPSALPYYALRTTLRLFIGLGFSLLFTFIFATWAAKSKHAERIIIPIIDVLQSVPILGFLSITIVAFITLFPNSLLGPECAAIFAIFTSQVWNMALSFYQSLRTVPEELNESVKIFHLSGWQRFWKLDVPFAMPGLLWNIMMSMSASWFFVVASEAITVANQQITLPGIGSYIFTAIQQANFTAVLYAILAMFIVIMLYDQLLFRPLAAWSDKFKFEHTASEEVAESWLINLFQRTKLLRRLTRFINFLWDHFVNCRLFLRKKHDYEIHHPLARKSFMVIAYVIFLSALALALYVLMDFIFSTVSLNEALHVFTLGLITGFKVMVLISLCSLFWIPVGVWIGLRPRVAQFAQPIIQFLAAFPANLLFPIVVILIVKFHLNVNIWTAPLMVLGTQWYIAFNVIAGTIALPKDLRQAATSFQVKGWLWWKRLILPGIFPYFVTGAITAAGGAWNASIVAEIVSWGSITLQAVGLGAFIEHYASIGDFPRESLGIIVMCVFVLVINHILWRPLYKLAEERYALA